MNTNLKLSEYLFND